MTSSNDPTAECLHEFMHNALRSFNPNFFTEGDITSGAFPKSFDDRGLEWVDLPIRFGIPGARIMSPIEASHFYGAYMSEFDEWRANVIPEGRQSFQGVVVSSSDLVAQCYQMTVREGMYAFHGEPLPDDKSAVLVLDKSLLDFITDSFFLIFGEYWTSPDASFRDLAKSIAVPEREVSANSQAPLRLTSDALSAGLEAKSAFETLLRLSSRADWPQGGAQEAARFLASMGRDQEAQRQYHRYVQSMAIHFLYAHEFGHFCYIWPNDSHVKLAEDWANAEMKKLGSTNAALREELFCDYVGSSNAVFQAFRFNVPACIPFSVIAWVLSCAMALVQRKQEHQTGEVTDAIELISARLQAQTERWIASDVLRPVCDSADFRRLTRSIMPRLAAHAVSSLSL